jgi:hypothetical protein
MRYPPAGWKGDGKPGGAYVGVPYRVVIHTTETTGLPGYDEGNSAPHLTYRPSNRSWTQHTDFDVAARALRNLSGGVETNRANALQVEIVCYSAKAIADQQALRLWVGDLTDHHLYDIRKFLEWCFAEFGVKDAWPEKQAFSFAQANATGFRMTSNAWTTFNAVCGHQHVPENTHWDPGALDWSALIDGSDVSFSKGLNETQWRQLYQLGIAGGSSEQAVIDYWIGDKANRSDTEHDAASASMFTALASKPGAGGVTEAQVRALINSSKNVVP